MKSETTKQQLAQQPAQAVPKALKRYLSLDDFEIAARRHLPRPIFGYISGAAERNASLDDNQRAYSEYRFVTRVLRDVSRRTQETTLLGKTYRAPFGIAPMGISALSAYRGDLVQAEAAREAGIPMIMSGSSLIPLETVAKDAPGTWFQAYLPGESQKIEALIERVERAGYDTLVLTVDTAVLANRENNIRTGFSTPLKPSARLAWDGVTRPRWLLGTALRTLVKHGMPHFENSYATRGAPIFSGRVVRDFGAKDHLNWTHLRQIRAQWKGKLVIKGIMAADDAIAARDHGVEGIIVSNHGGRQLDGTAAPLRVLPDIVDAVGGDIAVMIDGGIRRGTDVLKALALGADFVFVGRPFNYAASVAGKAGVAHAIGILHGEVQRNLGLLGLNRIDELSPDVLIRLPSSFAAAERHSQ
ncbi:dehydrogenase, FMN-dependent [Caballeronia fortuita]|uniref:Dehydrogenase, FMN-dependent n=1 Tax=Caballeronia fortuita TaxID=1777138 RepID=A0A158AF48_9BURK|nr:alpha-hydroxy acid oxidase [Caballeronia fortuita]SAK56481.1 dehydrogenase, FMN-dependent [Caballeronia fortuita]